MRLADKTAAVGKFLVPFCLEFKPFVDGIMAKEAVLRKLMGNATMAQILGKVHVRETPLAIAS